ncbi:MAG: hypothetical protein DHS20C21_19930 [Gemmatimonadota bacterium]|nr:MAG: hypothetical protein DHS20C21_19930 [Gemmatimonadota bacterium]
MNADVDPRIDKMMAYLYGELPEAEERAFRRLLEKDDALRAEFEELTETRELLGGWEVEERVPSFVLVEGAGATAAAQGGGRLAKILEPFRGFAVTPAWGLAAAAAILLVLAVGGFRVDRVDGGIALRFGEPTDPAVTEVAQPAPSNVPTNLEEFRSSIPIESSGREDLVVPASAYVTREDLKTYDENLILMLSELLNAYARNRDREVTEGFQSVYQEVNARQDYDYQQLSGRIDVLGRELLLETDRSARGFQEILTNEPPTQRTPVGSEEEE